MSPILRLSALKNETLPNGYERRPEAVELCNKLQIFIQISMIYMLTSTRKYR